MQAPVDEAEVIFCLPVFTERLIGPLEDRDRFRAKGEDQIGRQRRCFQQELATLVGRFTAQQVGLPVTDLALVGRDLEQAQRVVVKSEIDVVSSDFEVGLVRHFIADHGAKARQCRGARLQ